VFALDVPGIHVLAALYKKDVNGRDKPGHDECLESSKMLTIEQ
jgi:hypothetical protein